VPVGYWEAKDEKDDLATEIEDKFPKGCPKNTIIFSGNVTALLWQDGHEAGRAAFRQTSSYSSPSIAVARLSNLR
jgi:hypothetical protein